MYVLFLIIGFISGFQYAVLIINLILYELKEIGIHKKADLLYWLIPGGVLIILINQIVKVYDDLD